MVNAVLTVAIITAALGQAQEPHHPDAVEVFHCTFDSKWDSNFDRWPDGWVRRQGLEFPPYLEVGLKDDPTSKTGQSLEVKLDGGGAVIYSPPIAVDARFSYVLEAAVKTAGLEHDRAYLSVTFYDADKRPLETLYSPRLKGTNDWQMVRVGPASPSDETVEMAVIGLHVGPQPKGQQDLTGSARFDDIWLARLPRMTLDTNSEHNVYTDPKGVRVRCTLSGILERDPEMRFELLDASGNSIARHSQRLDGEIIAQKSSRTGELAGQDPKKPSGYAGVTEWQPPITDFGFYRVRVEMASPHKVMHRREITLAMIRPLGKPVKGEFGWTLPQGDNPLPLDALATLLPHVGINWLKLPIWYGEEDPARGDRLMWFAERLGMSGIELVGLLDNPPTDVRTHFGVEDQLSAANIFSADPALWFPSLDPVMTRLSLKIHWWQLGGDHDTSFVGYPDLPKKIAEIRKQLYRFGQEVHLGLGWNWLAQPVSPASSPWEFLSLSANPPLTGPEMATYLHGSRDSKVRRWVLVEPLPRDEYPMEVRARDLVDQMMSAKIEQADGIFVPNPFSTRHGLMNDDGTPGELLLPWRTTALVLGGSKYLGSVRMPQGSRNHIYSRAGEAVMIVWNDRPVDEVIYLGEDVQQVDMWGRMTKPEQTDEGQVIHVGPLPTFILGINEQVTLWRMQVEFAQKSMPSVFGKAHHNAIVVRNTFPQGVGGEVTLVTPPEWKVYPQRSTFKLAVDELLEKEFEVTLPFNASSGEHPVRLDFDINADRRYRFSVYRDISVGQGEVTIDVTTRLEDDGRLLVEQRMTNNTDAVVDFKCLLHAPDRRRQTNQVFRLSRGQDIKRYWYTNGRQLVGKELWLRAEELGGERILNVRCTAEE